MKIKNLFTLLGKIALLTVLGLIVTTLSSSITPRPEIVKAAAGSASSQILLYLLLDRFVVALIFAFLLANTTLRGLRLAGLIFWLTFGITTFMMQIETLLFGSAFPGLSTLDVIKLVGTAFVGSIMYIPLSMLVMDRWKGNNVVIRPLFLKKYLPRLVLLAIIYPMLYFSFGYFVAWQSAAVREFYATSTITTAQPLLTIIQIGRGALWVLAGLPLLVMFEKRWHILVASILCYALLPSFSLILPSTLMPEAVRLTHLVEISTSMSIFGMLFGWVMTGKSNLNNHRT